MEATAAETGLVLNVQRLSTEDGPGIRTTVFLKQCPLACTWCHNPESIRGRPEVQWYGSRCIGCHSCLKACPQGCVAAGPNGIRVDRERCDGCGECAAGCPSNALEMLGVRRDADTLVEMLCRDRAYFEASDGGVTLSGGEPLAQPAFAAALLRGLHARGVATAVDTCGFAAPHVVQEVLPLADLVLLDLKIMDPVLHERFTGRDNALILENARRVAAMGRAGGPRLWVRTPLIPGVTASAENMQAIGAWMAANLEAAVDRWDLCAFNNLCREQYARLEVPWAFARVDLMRRSEIEALGAAARASGVDPRIVSMSGAVRREPTPQEDLS